jgi:hypothetical protein
MFDNVLVQGGLIWHVARDFLKSYYQVVPCLNQCVVRINKNC